MAVTTIPKITGVVLGGEIDPAIEARIETLEDKYVRTTRFEIISSGTSGSITIPESASIVLDDFGGTVDAVISEVDSGIPTLEASYDSSSIVVGTSFDGSGNYVLSSAPASYPVALIYRVQQRLKDFDSSSSNIIGTPNVFTTSIEKSFEIVSKNISSWNYALNYSSEVLVSIVYTSGSRTVTKTFNYTSGTLTSLVLSGDTPSGIDLTKTLNYTGGDLTSIAYS